MCIRCAGYRGCVSSIRVSRASRRLSKIVFGQELRLAVMLFIARHRDGLFCYSDVAEGVEVRSASSVQEPLRALVDAGLIVRQEGLPGDRHRWYQRIESACWVLAEELASKVVDEPGPPIAPVPQKMAWALPAREASQQPPT